LHNDLDWLRRLACRPGSSQFAAELRDHWLSELARWHKIALDPESQAAIDAARQAVYDACRIHEQPVKEI
jgi:hypothetical protein